MKRARLQAAVVGGTPDEVEQAFYEALNQGDVQQLMACWAEEDETVCVRHGGARWVGPAVIRSAFEALFAQGAVKTQPQHVQRIEALACAVHHLIECVSVRTPQGVCSIWLNVTNVYHKTAQGWRMVAHHASPGPLQNGTDAAARPTVLH